MFPCWRAAGFPAQGPLAQRKLLHGLLTGLPSMQLVRAETSTSWLWLLGCFSPCSHTRQSSSSEGKTQRIALLAAFFALRGH